MGQQDISYKEFFSDPQNVADLLRGFVDKDFINELDYSTLERANADFIRKESGERHDDMIWRLRWKERWLYVYLILEFQSSVDYTMPVRIMSYTAELWLSLLSNKNTEYHKTRKIPPVLPIVLYNGIEDWDAARDVGEMLQDKSISNVSVDYYLIDELHPTPGAKDAISRGILNCVTALIEVERTKDKANLEEVLHELAKKLDTKEKLKSFETFLRFMRRFLAAKFHKTIPEDFNNMQEVITMTRDFDAISRADERILERKRTIKHMISKGLTIEQIADYGGYDIKEVRACFDEK